MKIAAPGHRRGVRRRAAVRVDGGVQEAPAQRTRRRAAARRFRSRRLGTARPRRALSLRRHGVVHRGQLPRRRRLATRAAGRRPLVAAGVQLVDRARSARRRVRGAAERRVADKSPSDWTCGNAHTAKACLDCHAIDADESELTDAARHTPHDGVGCEACHGAAEAWLDPHKWDAWSSLSAAQKVGPRLPRPDRPRRARRDCAPRATSAPPTATSITT